MLAMTMQGLCKNDLRDTEIVVVDDGSDQHYAEQYPDLCRLLEASGAAVVYHKMEPYEAYRIDGHNNPARANNEALKLASGERIFWLSSDVILPPHALARARRFGKDDAVFVGQVVDMDTGGIFLGPGRLFPMMWFVGTSKAACEAIGGFDENYLRGMAFEDNDFMGRLACHVGRVVFDWDVLSFHQSHPNTAYSDQMEGFKRSADYTKTKWHGVPFSGDKPVLKIKTAMHALGLPEWQVSLMHDDIPAASSIPKKATA
jgi:glycosyltransferase involved in cell wall biosynthesis